MGSTGKASDRSDSYVAGKQDIESYAVGHSRVAELRAPLLLRSNQPKERLFVAALDGTGNSLYDDKPENWSVVARLYDQIESAKSDNIAAGYVEGTFTQNGLLRAPARLLDGRFAHTFEERVETAYYQFCKQAHQWLEDDPEASIRVVGIGFSRGAEEVAALQRMIHERGIRDPTDAKVRENGERLVTRIEYADLPLLVPPGQTLQAALLFDPVATGVEDEDRRFPSSTMSIMQISAEDERRNLFPANDHIPVGFSEDYRNLNVVVGGAHSDIGNTYLRNGLGVLSFNLGVAFLNRLSDRPFVQEQPVPEDPSQFVVHRSELGMWGLYRTSDFDRDEVRVRLEDQSPLAGVQRKDPIDPVLEAQVERRTGTSPTFDGPRADAPRPTGHPAAPSASHRGATDSLLDRALAAYLGPDDRAFSRVMDEYRQSPSGQAWEREQAAAVQALREHEVQQRRASMPPPEPVAPSTPVMRM